MIRQGTLSIQYVKSKNKHSSLHKTMTWHNFYQTTYSSTHKNSNCRIREKERERALQNTHKKVVYKEHIETSENEASDKRRKKNYPYDSMAKLYSMP